MRKVYVCKSNSSTWRVGAGGGQQHRWTLGASWTISLVETIAAGSVRNLVSKVLDGKEEGTMTWTLNSTHIYHSTCTPGHTHVHMLVYYTHTPKTKNCNEASQIRHRKINVSTQMQQNICCRCGMNFVDLSFNRLK